MLFDRPNRLNVSGNQEEGVGYVAGYVNYAHDSKGYIRTNLRSFPS